MSSGSPPDLTRLRITREAPSASASAPSRRLWMFAGVGVLVAAVAGVLLARPRALAVQTAPVESTGGATSVTGEGISANGYVVARTKASVSAKVAGRLEYLGVSEGTRVRRGEIIARIESPGFSAALSQARADVQRDEVELAQARRDLERARRLRQEELVSDVEVENASTRVASLQAQLASSRAAAEIAGVNLENTRVRAPFDGTVLRKDAEVGEIVAPAAAGGGLTRTAIVTMADLGTLEVEVDVNEAYIAQIRNGQPASITLDAYADTSFRGAVRQVVPTADRQKATVLVKVAIQDRDPRILPEMGAKVIFLRSGGPAIAAVPVRITVPQDAVVQSSTGAKVWVVTNQTVSSRAVQLGPRRGDRIEVMQGLSGGETVVLQPPPALRDGAKVRVATS